MVHTSKISTMIPVTEHKKIISVDTPGSKTGAQNFLRMLAKSDDALAIVNKLSSHDLLLAVKEADDEQKAQLLAMADREQFHGMIDLDCWGGDRPDIGKILDLISPLVATGLGGSMLAYDRLDKELATLLLKKYIIVHVREDKDDEVPAAEESELIACSDGFYFIEIPMPDDLPEEIRQIINGLLYKPFDEYHRELETVKHDFQSDLEETAYRWRNGRLADLGFASRHESQIVLSPRDPKQLKQMIKEATTPPYPLRSEIKVPAVFKENLFGAELLDESLRLLAQSDDPVFVERATNINVELAALTSLYLTATGCDLGNFEDIANRTQVVRDILALGLNAISDGDPLEGARALAFQIPTVIFQAGMGLLVPARNRALAVLQDPAISHMGQKGALLDAPYSLVIDLLSMPVPMRLPALDNDLKLSPILIEPLPSELRAFSKTSELKSALRLVSEAEQLGQLLVKLGWSSSGAVTIDDTLGSAIVLTVLANAFGGYDLKVKPVSSKLATDFTSKVLEQDEDQFCADAISALCQQLDLKVDSSINLEDLEDPKARLLLRLVYLGRRSLADTPEVQFILND